MNNRVHVMREAVVKIAQLLAGKKIKVTQRGVKAFVESDTRTGAIRRINLPYIPDDASDEFIEAIQGYLDHEVGHILFSDFKEIGRLDALGVGELHNIIEDPRIEKCMAREFRGSGYNLRRVSEFVLQQRIFPAVKDALTRGDLDAAQQALVVPVIRSLAGQDVHTDFLSTVPNSLWASVLAALEDLRPKFLSMASTKDAGELAQEVAKRFGSSPPPKEPPPGDSGDESGPGESGPDEDDGKGESSSSAQNEGEQSEDGKQPEDGKPKKGDQKGDKKEKTDEKGQEAGDAEKPEGEGSEKPEDGKGGADGEDENGDADSNDGGSDSGDDSDQDGDQSPGAAGDGDDGSAGEQSAPQTPADGQDGSGDQPGSDADGSGSEADGKDDGREKHVNIDIDAIGGFDDALSDVISMQARKYADASSYSIFTKDFDVVELLRADPKWMEKVGKLEDRVDHMVGPLQKNLERIMAARSAVVWAGGQRRGRLHSAGLSRLTFGDDRVFRRREESRSQEWAVEILVDMSGSMGSSNKISLACDAAYACAAVFERMRIPCEVICFTTTMQNGAMTGEDMKKCNGEFDPEKRKTTGASYMKKGYSRVEPLYMPILKTYEDRMTPEVKSRFAGLPDMGRRANNIDGECLEIAANRLAMRREAGKLLIVMSDGHPHGAGNTDEQASHLKRVVEKIKKSKALKLFAVGINDASVSRFYPDHVVLRNVALLPETIMSELKRLIFNV